LNVDLCLREGPRGGLSGASHGGLSEAPRGGLSGASRGGLSGAPRGGLSGASRGGLSGASYGSLLEASGLLRFKCASLLAQLGLQQLHAGGVPSTKSSVCTYG